MRLFFPSLLCAATVCAAADLPKGAIVDAVVCRADPSQSYALYLPSSYTPDREWPVLYCFDPVARGRIPLERFRDAAEKYGYVVAGSNNSRNGKPSLGPAQAMWTDANARFRIDPRRAYVAGFSGGARVATGLALASGALAGVVACGAGFPNGPLPSKVPFLFFGTAGTEDFNYHELKIVDRHLTRLGAPHRIVFFPGGHDWAPAPLATEALEWFELQAMKDGLRPRDDAFLAEILHKRLESARRSEAAGDLTGALAEYSSLAADFQGSPSSSAEFAAKAAELAGSKQVKQNLAVERDEAAEQQLVMKDLFLAAGAGNVAGYGGTVARLRKQAGAPDDSSARKVARRALAEAYIAAAAHSGQLLATRQYAAAAPWLEFEIAVRGDSLFLYWQLTDAYVRSGDRKRAARAAAGAIDKSLNYFLGLASSRR
jgi:dienelactone hydrolase